MPPSDDPIEYNAADQSAAFSAICDDLVAQSYSVQNNALPEALIKLLSDRVHIGEGPHFKPAGIGRKSDHHKNQNIRRDQIAWIDDEMLTDQKWNEWTVALQMALNKELFLGLTSFESHYACYEKGGFYKKHVDAFSGANNRKISIVLFLNDHWVVADEGELRLFVGQECDTQILVSPKLGTLVIFMSDVVPHEVLKTNCTRYSIAGWYR